MVFFRLLCLSSVKMAYRVLLVDGRRFILPVQNQMIINGYKKKKYIYIYIYIYI